MEMEDSVIEQKLNVNLREYRIAYQEGTAYKKVSSSDLDLSDEIISTYSGMIRFHHLVDGTSIFDPLFQYPDESDENYCERLLRIKKLYDLEELSDDDIVRYLVAMFIIRGDPLGEYRRDTKQLISKGQMVVIKKCNIDTSDD